MLECIKKLEPHDCYLKAGKRIDNDEERVLVIYDTR